MNKSRPVTAASLPELPAAAGIGLRTEHFQAIMAQPPDIGFFEIHAENYLVDGGPFHYYLERIRENYPLSIHGVALSIGGEEALDEAHLDALDRLLQRYQPQAFSEHLAWSSHGGSYLNDLLPLAYNRETLMRVCRHIDQTQARLKRRMLLENPATYLEFAESTMDEAFFISEIIKRTGCGLLLDVNNVYVSCCNHQRDPALTLRALPLHAVSEIHLAGHSRQCDAQGNPLWIDDHGADVDPAVWDLYQRTLALTGPMPTLLERDNNIPPLDTLLAEAQIAQTQLQRAQHNTQRRQAATYRPAPS